MTDGFGPAPVMVNGFDGSGLAGLPAATRELIARREAALGGAYRLFYDEPVEFVRGAGVYLYDPDGRRLPRRLQQRAVGRALAPARHRGGDAAAGDAQHAHQVPDRRRRRLRRAAARDAPDRPGARDVHLHRERGERPGAADRPAPHRRHRGDRDRQRLPRGDRRGGGALPQPGRAVPLGRGRPGGARAGRRGRISRPGSRPPSRTCSGTGCGWRRSWPTRSSPPTACCPTRPGSSPRSPTLVRAAGGLYIADEVQSGFGRTGSQLWGYQRHPGLTPDIVTMGKPMGNGLPIAGLVARESVLAEFGRRGAVLQHLRRQPGLRRRRVGRARRARGRGPAGQRGGHRRLPQGRALTRLAAGSPVLGGRARRGAVPRRGRGLAGDRRAVGRAGRGDRQRDARRAGC